MKIEIKNRYSGEVIFGHDCKSNTLRKTVEAAIKAGANLYGANLYGANLHGANLLEANLIGANLLEANLIGADLRGANLRGANLLEANLHGANLIGANLIGADLRGANLSRANLLEANLNGADLLRADLLRADLRGANLYGAYLSGANLNEANLSGTVGNMREIRSMQLERYPVAFTKDTLQIGCQSHTHDEWKAFSDGDIAQMDAPHSLKWWSEWKALIFQAIELTFGQEQQP